MSKFNPGDNPMKDQMGRYRTKSLFWEFRHEDGSKYVPLFTIKDAPLVKGDVTYPSLKQLYMSYDHVPGLEYDFAMDVFGSWDHWCKLCDEAFGPIRNELKNWRLELDVKLRAQALRNMIRAAGDNDPKGLQAAKYLAEQGYSTKRGRPSKEEVERERKVQAGVSKDLEADMQRLGLTVVNGTK